MPASAKKTKPIQEIHKPTMIGSWNGRSARKLARGRFLSIIITGVAYLFMGMLLSFDSLWGRILCSLVIVAITGIYHYSQGLEQGKNEAALGEIMYERQAEGKTVSPEDRDRCFHPAKGFFAVLLGAVPFLVFTVVFACITKMNRYSLGVLPSWTEGLMRNSELGDALSYYSTRQGMTATDIMRVIDRAMIMPFISVATLIGDRACLLVERLSPILILLAPMGYGIGYSGGIKERVRINTGIKAGVDKKRKKERRERKKRQNAQRKQPEQLV